jgi:hypothetical protein
MTFIARRMGIPASRPYRTGRVLVSTRDVAETLLLPSGSLVLPVARCVCPVFGTVVRL